MRFGYIRVSARDQNADLQRNALEKHGVDRVYTDKMTGRSMDRPQFNEMMKVLREGDTVVVWKLDRLGRTTKGIIEFFEHFEREGIGFVSLIENLDMATPMGRFLITILVGFGEMEADLARERRQAGQASARARGKMGGRPKKDPSAVKEAITLYKSNEYTFREITAKTGVSKGTIYKYLKEEKGSADPLAKKG